MSVLGVTYTEKLEGISVLDQYNSTTEYQVFIHVYGASSDFFTLFVKPELVWNFRLKSVISINASGHKYGLAHPGVGWGVARYSLFTRGVDL